MARIGEIIGPNNEVLHPQTSASVVYLEDGRSVEQVLSDDIDYGNVVFQESSYKFSSDVEDDFAKTVIIKGQTYQNILPEPSTHVLRNNKEMFKVNEGLDPNVEIVDGVSKSAILKGQTLVNLWGTKREHFFTNGTFENSVLTSNGWCCLHRVEFFKPNTEYTLITNIISISDTNTYFKANNVASNGIFKTETNKLNKVGIYVEKVVSYDDFTGREYSARSLVSGGGTIQFNMVVLEGDYTQSPPVDYFEGMQSVNLHANRKVTKLTWGVGKYYNENGELTTTNANQNHRYSEEYIEIDPNMAYRASGANNYKNLNFYDKNKNHLLKVTGTAQLGNGALTDDIVATAPSNAKYLRYNMAIVGNNHPESAVIYNDTLGIPLASTEIVEDYTYHLPTLTTIGKNLFDIQDHCKKKRMTLVGSNGLQCNQGVGSKDKAYAVNMTIKPDTQYTVSWGNVVIEDDKGGWALQIVILYTDGTHREIYMRNNNGRLTSDANKQVDCIIIANPWNVSSTVYSIQIEEGATATTYEPYKINNLSVSEDIILRSLPNGAKDTLNLNTGEYVKRIGEIVLDGTQNWTLKDGNWAFENTFGFSMTISDMVAATVNDPAYKKGESLTCSHFPCYGGCSLSSNALPNDIEMVGIDINKTLGLRIEKNKLSTPDVQGLKEWLSQNPVTVQYELAVPVIKTIDLSSSGNWEKVILNGSEDWTKEAFTSGIVRWRASLPNTIANDPCCCDKLPVYPTSDKRDMDYVRCSTNLVWVYQKDTSLTLEQFRAKLQSDPLTVWYQVNTHKESTQVKQPIFFADGHVIQSSQNKTQLLPTLKYRAKTSNSYVLNLMRPDTTYTIKAGTASGTATLNGIEAFSLETNRTFLSPSEEAMGNRLLVINGDVSNLMILEGDLTNQELPYFEGIQSAFESSEVEITTTGKNLFDAYKYPFDTTSAQTLRVEVLSSNAIRTYCNEPIAWRSAFVTYQLEPNSWYKVQCQAEGNGVKAIEINVFEMGNNWNPDVTQCNESSNMMGTFRTQDSGLVKLTFQGSGNQSATFDNTYTNIQIEKVESKNSEATAYEPYCSSVTKLQLPDALRSLPNGRHDELIIKRDQKKATLIQRVGYGILDGKQGFVTAESPIDSQLYQPFYCHDVFGNTAVVNKGVNIWCDKFEVNGTAKGYRDFTRNIFYQYTDYSARFAGMIMKEDLCGKHVNKWFEANPTTVFYTLASPVITEIDLEGYPHLCRDGHIFLTSEIAPTVGIEYSINQGHRLMGQVETVQRHDKQFSQLERYFADLVYSDYNLTLLRLNECLIEEEEVFDEESTVNN